MLHHNLCQLSFLLIGGWSSWPRCAWPCRDLWSFTFLLRINQPLNSSIILSEWLMGQQGDCILKRTALSSLAQHTNSRFCLLRRLNWETGQ